MVCTLGRKWILPYGQKVVDIDRKWSAFTGRPRLGWMDGWHEDGGGMMVEAARPCAKDWKEWSPVAYVDDLVRCGHFCMLRSFGPPSSDLVAYQLEWGGMQLGKP